MFRNRDPFYFHDPRHPHFEFSNDSRSDIEFEGHVYPTATHLFQARKFIGLHPTIAMQIRRALTVEDAYRQAEFHYNSQRSDWSDVHLNVMEEVIEAKFIQHPSLLQKLRDTGHRVLINNDSRSSFWGTGPDNRGRNELGKAMMRVRDKLRNL